MDESESRCFHDSSSKTSKLNFTQGLLTVKPGSSIKEAGLSSCAPRATSHFNLSKMVILYIATREGRSSAIGRFRCHVFCCSLASQIDAPIAYLHHVAACQDIRLCDEPTMMLRSFLLRTVMLSFIFFVLYLIVLVCYFPAVYSAA